MFDCGQKISCVCFDVGKTLVNFSGEHSLSQKLALTYNVDVRTFRDKTDGFIYLDLPVDELAHEMDLVFGHKQEQNVVELISFHKTRQCLFDDVIITLKALHKRNIQIGIISNTYMWSVISMKDLGLSDYFEHEIYSYQVKCSKPDVKIFKKAEESFGMPSTKCMYVGDSMMADVAGAKNAGWKAVLLDREHKTHIFENLMPDFIIYSLKDIVCIIDQLNG